MWVMRTLLLVLNLLSVVLAETQVPCFFIFGDSLADPGNNNGLITLSKKNYPPYGIDFTYGSTGRFTNGRTMVDFITQFLGFEDFIPPFANVSGEAILTGVNYASGSSGIREESGTHRGELISLSKQIENHRSIVKQLENYTDSVDDYLNQCLYSVGTGSNDYNSNYFLPEFYPTSTQYTTKQYAAALYQRYYDQLKTLYDLGARKVIVWGVAPIGCCPVERAKSLLSACDSAMNVAVIMFNVKVKELVEEFNSNLTDAQFIFVNSFTIGLDIFTHVSTYGLTVTTNACCGSGRNNGEINCSPYDTPCTNRRTYAFWDEDHPTEVINAEYAKRAYSALNLNDTYPTDIKQLVESTPSALKMVTV